jgi:hypothetical protein
MQLLNGLPNIVCKVKPQGEGILKIRGGDKQ